MKKTLIALIVMSNIAASLPKPPNPGDFFIENDLPSGLLINEWSNSAQVNPNKNPDKDQWSSFNFAAGPGDTFFMSLSSSDYFGTASAEYINPTYGIYNYNSQATLTITITNPGDQVIATCIVPVGFYLDVTLQKLYSAIFNMTNDPEDRVECGNTTYYVQDLQGKMIMPGFKTNYLFVRAGW